MQEREEEQAPRNKKGMSSAGRYASRDKRRRTSTINQHDVESAVVKRELRAMQREGGIFGSEPSNMSINSKTRFIDTTLTAYKLLDSAYVNQYGNPNNLDQRFKQGPSIKITRGLIKDILGSSSEESKKDRRKSPT